MVTPAQNLAFLAFPGLSAGEVSLVNYVHMMSRLEQGPFVRSAFSPMNLTDRMMREIEEGRRAPADRILLSAASLVAGAIKQEKVLSTGLGEVWRTETRFVPAVESELEDLNAVIVRARDELKLWRKALAGFRFDGMSVDESFDLSEEEPLASLLKGLQLAFLTRIENARNALEAYGPRSMAGVELYFNVASTRKSGPIPKIPADVLLRLAAIPENS